MLQPNRNDDEKRLIKIGHSYDRFQVTISSSINKLTRLHA